MVEENIFNYNLNWFTAYNESGKLNKCISIFVYVNYNLKVKKKPNHSFTEADSLILNVDFPHMNTNITLVAVNQSSSASVNTFFGSLNFYLILDRMIMLYEPAI